MILRKFFHFQIFKTFGNLKEDFSIILSKSFSEQKSYTKFLLKFLHTITPCPSAPVRCAPVASPVNKFAEIGSPIPNYDSPANK